jgi:hypothetical protein
MILRRLLLGAAFLPLAASPAAAEVEFKPGGGGFRVMFPGGYRVRIEQVSTRFGNTRGVIASSERDDVKLYMQYLDYPGSAAREGTQRLLDGLRFGRTVKGRVRSEERFQLDGNPAQREVVDLQVQGQPVIVALDVLRGLRLYSVFCIVAYGQEGSDEVRRFIDSFELLPP